MFDKLRNYWNNNGFEILIVLSLVIITFLALFSIGKKGSWSNYYRYNPRMVNKNRFNRRSPPKDSSGELECRRVLEELFKKPFNKARPNFLRNPVTGNSFNLELDCYNSEMKLACEYSGAQHYKYIPFFHRNKDAFTNQKYRDFMKKTFCQRNGVTLIEVPYTVKKHEIRSFLVRELRKRGYNV